MHADRSQCPGKLHAPPLLKCLDPITDSMFSKTMQTRTNHWTSSKGVHYLPIAKITTSSLGPAGELPLSSWGGCACLTAQHHLLGTFTITELKRVTSEHRVWEGLTNSRCAMDLVLDGWDSCSHYRHYSFKLLAKAYLRGAQFYKGVVSLLGQQVTEWAQRHVFAALGRRGATEFIFLLERVSTHWGCTSLKMQGITWFI